MCQNDIFSNIVNWGSKEREKYPFFPFDKCDLITSNKRYDII